MRKKKFSLRSKMDLHLATWIGSYLLILLIPILLGFTLYTVMANILAQEVEKVHEKSLTELKISLDNTMADAVHVGTVLRLDSRMEELNKYQGVETLDSEGLMIASGLQKTLADLRISNETIDEIGIYFKGYDYLLTSSSSARGENILPLLKRSFGMDINRLNSLTSAPEAENWYLEGQGENIFYAGSVLSRYKPIADSGIVIIRLKEKPIIQAMTATMNTIGGDIWLMSGAENLHIKSDTLPETLDFTSQSVKEKKESRYLYGSLPLEQSGWELFTVTAKSHVMGKVNFIRQLLYLHIFLCLLAGGVLSYFLARKYYDPVKKISSLLEKRVGGSVANEMGRIYTSLSNLQSEAAHQHATITDQTRVVERFHLAKALEGQEESLKKISFPYKHFVVVGISSQEGENIFLEETYRGRDAEKRTDSAIMRDLAENSMMENYLCQAIDLKSIVYCVVNLADDQVAFWKPQMTLLCQRIQDAFMQMFGITVDIAISTCVYEPRELSSQAVQVRETLEHAAMLEKTGVLVQVEDQNFLSGTGQVDAALPGLEIAFLRSLEQEDFDAAREQLLEIGNIYSSTTINQAKIIRVRSYALLSRVLEILNHLQQIDEIYAQVIQKTDLMTSRSMADGYAVLQQMLQDLNQAKDESILNRSQNVVQKVKNYIDDHYENPELSVAKMAEIFQTNVSYLSRNFKKQVGENILDYLHKTRIEQVKKLLATPLTLTQIAEKTGYYNSLAMIRVFKRYQGETPGRYRERLSPTP